MSAGMVFVKEILSSALILSLLFDLFFYIVNL